MVFCPYTEKEVMMTKTIFKKVFILIHFEFNILF